MRATLVVPDRDPAAPSGGDRYDAQLAAHWPGELQVWRASGGWPHPDRDGQLALASLLVDVREGPVLLDGLVGCAVPELVAVSAAVRTTAILVHSTLSAGSGAEGEEARELDERERRALLAAALVVTTSAWSAADLARRYGIEGVVVARPGAERAAVAAGSSRLGPGDLGDRGAWPGDLGHRGPRPQLLTLAALTPVKNHTVLLRALSQLRDVSWSLVCAGPAPDRAFADALEQAAGRLGLGERISWPGPLAGEALGQVWAATDLLVHPSRSETWGMVVTEALARGIPAVVARETGAEEALTWSAGDVPGAAVRVDEPGELAAVLRRWLTDPVAREQWRAAALERRERLPEWDETARVVHGALLAATR